MKILFINQVSRNHGDEAACLALTRTLYDSGYKNITISYNNNHLWNERCFIKHKDVRQIWSIPVSKWERRSVKLYLIFPSIITKLIFFLFSNLRIQYNCIKNADFVVSMPGGPNLGKYEDIIYLWRIYVANKLGKRYAIYSPSIGPFNANKPYYVRRAKKVLSEANFVSLRDMQSYSYAQELGIKFHKAIDTAFLESPDYALPKEIEVMLPEKYVVIVPHELYKWHRDFTAYSKNDFDSFFRRLIDKFVSNGEKIVLLPQTYESHLDDERYFYELSSNKPNIIVVPTKYPSDIQQMIIAKAEYVVGARYHTIVFAINNKTPFFCLSYEHKMIDMLRILGMEKSLLGIDDALKNPESATSIIFSCFMSRCEIMAKLVEAQMLAKKIARGNFSEFTGILKNTAKAIIG